MFVMSFIVYCLDSICINFLAVVIFFQRQMTNVSSQINDANKLKETFDVLVLICKLFYSLNYQVFPYH